MKKFKKLIIAVILIIIYVLCIKSESYSVSYSEIKDAFNSSKTIKLGYNALVGNKQIYCVDFKGRLSGPPDDYWVSSVTNLKNSVVKILEMPQISRSSINYVECEVKISPTLIPIPYFKKTGNLHSTKKSLVEEEMKYILSGGGNDYGLGYSNGDGTGNYTIRQMVLWDIWNDYCSERSNKTLMQENANFNIFNLSAFFVNNDREGYNKGKYNNSAPHSASSIRLKAEAEAYANKTMSGSEGEEASLDTAGEVRVNNLKSVPIKINSYTGAITAIYAYNGNELVGSVDLNKYNIKNGTTVNVNGSKEITNIKVSVSPTNREAEIYVLQNLTNYQMKEEGEDNGNPNFGQRLIYVPENNISNKVYTINVKKNKGSIKIWKKDSDTKSGINGITFDLISKSTRKNY